MAELTSAGGYDWNLRAGSLEVRLAETPAEVRAAQSLRFRVFYQEMSARPSLEMARIGRDFDDYDRWADHLLVIDNAVGAGARGVIGTYRLIRREAADRVGRFYSSDEYDIASLLAYPGEVLELGRSCVDPRYRTGQTMQLLWRGISAYLDQFGIDLMFGCASLPGIDPRQLSLPLSYLHHYHLAPPALRPRAVAGRRVDMDLMPPEAVDQRAALAALPPLIKGYLRLGGHVGDGAVVDEQFHTTDVCVIVKTAQVTDRYQRHHHRHRKPVLVYPPR